MFEFHDTDRPAPLYTLEGLSAYLKSNTTRPGLLDEATYKGLDETTRNSYNHSRKMFLSGGIVLETAYMTKAKRLLTQAFAENMGRNSGHTGLMLSGAATAGKTTSTKALMRLVYGHYRRAYPDFERDGKIPVAFVEVPAGSTGKLLMKTFADFLGLPVATRDTMVDIRARVVDAFNRAGTQLIVVDELHNLSASNRATVESIDVLKGLHNDIAASFVYAGIDLAGSTLFEGVRGRQLAGRFSLINVETFETNSPESRKEWLGVIKGFEDALPLHSHKAQSLMAMHSYLFDRTGGSIGSLAKLLTNAARQSIIDGSEAITKELLDEQVLDSAAEKYYLSTLATPKSRRKQNALLEALAPQHA